MTIWKKKQAKTKRIQAVERKKESRKRKDLRECRKRKRKRDAEIRKLCESDPELGLSEIVCQTKKGFATRMEAIAGKPRSCLRVYECDVCMGWHFTSKKETA